MNKERRRRLREVRKSLCYAYDEVEAVLDEEDETRDNMPENLQYSERYEESEEASEKMSEVADLIQEAIDAIEEII